MKKDRKTQRLLGQHRPYAGRYRGVARCRECSVRVSLPDGGLCQQCADREARESR